MIKKGCIVLKMWMVAVIWLGLAGAAYAQATPGPGVTDKDIQQATRELQSNTQEVRKNLRELQTLKRDSNLEDAKRRRLLTQARDYLQELERYRSALHKVNEETLQRSADGRVFLRAKKEFDQELERFKQELQGARPPR